jgi:hypothetical protein
MITRPSLLLVERSRRQVFRNKPREARLGDGTGNIYAPDGMYWVKFAGPADENGNATYNGPASRVFGGAKNFIEQDERDVYIKLNHKGQPEIDGPVYENLQAAGIKPSVIHANSPYRQFVRTQDIQDFMARRLSKTSMKVRVGELFYVDRNGIPQFYPGSTASTHADFTASIPATDDYECFALLSFDQDAFAASTPPYLTVSVSTPRAAVPNLSIANMIVEIQEAYTTRVPYSMPIQVYRLYNGMTGLGDPADLDNRQWINVPIGISSLSPLTTKGDIFTYSTENTRLPVGANGTVLGPDSAEATGLKYFTYAQVVNPVLLAPGPIGSTTPNTGVFSALSLLISGFKAIFTHANTADRTYPLPNYDGQLATLAGTETLSGKTLTTPVIADYTNAQHAHTAAASGGQLTDAALSAPVGVAKGGSGADMSATGGANSLLKQTSVGGAFTAALMALADIPNTLITLAKLANGTAGKFIGFNASGAAAELDGALDVTGATGEAWAIRDTLYLDETSNTWFKVDIDAVPVKLSATRGVALAAASHPSSGNRIRRSGLVPDYTGLTPGAPLYASLTAGGYTHTKPAVSDGSGQMAIVSIGYAIDTTTAFVDADAPIDWVRREWLDDGETLEIAHIADTDPHLRVAEASIELYTEEVKETYASSNQDSALAIKRVPVGSTVVVDNSGAAATAVGDSGGTDFRLAQSFTPSVSGYLTSITFNAGATAGSPSGLPQYGIYTNNAISSIPTATSLAGSTGTMGAWTASANNTITFPGGPYLAAGTTYWLMLSLPTMQATGANYSVNRNATGAYGSGQMKWDSTTGASFPGTWAGGGGTNDMRVSITTAIVFDTLAQGITVSADYDVTHVQLWLKRTGTLSGDLQALMYLGSGGVPIAPIAGSALVAASSVGTSYGYIDFVFTTPVNLFAGDWYIVLFSTDTYSSSNYIEWGVDTSSPSYSGGVALTETNGTWAAASPAADGCFILYGVDTYYTVPVNVGLGSPVIEAHYGDTGYADADTLTTFENVYGQTIHATVRVRMG